MNEGEKQVEYSQRLRLQLFVTNWFYFIKYNDNIECDLEINEEQKSDNLQIII